MRNYLADYNLFAVSANLKESELNVEQTLDTSLLVAKSNILQLDYRRETNSDELTGKEEPDTVYDLGALASGSFDFDKAQAQHFALLYAYALGAITSSTWGTGYKHVITPTSDMSLPSMTAAMRLGKTIMKRRFASLFVDTVTSVFAKDSWAKISATLKGTGKYTDNMYKETVNAAYNATSLTLASNAVHGTTDAERLDNVHMIRVKVPTTGEWKEVTYTAVTANAPAVITIVAPGSEATTTDYEILYVPTEPAWCAFPSRISEPPLRVTDLVLKIGGKWDGSAFLGGRTLAAEIDSIEYSLNNQMLIEYRVGGTGSYANFAIRQGRQQTITLNRLAKEFIMQQKIKDNEYIGVYMKATGAEFETGKNYYIEIVFPRCNVLKAPFSVGGKLLAEAGDIIVLEDDIYGSVRIEVANKVQKYASAV